MSNNYNSKNTRPFYNTDTFDLCHDKGVQNTIKDAWAKYINSYINVAIYYNRSAKIFVNPVDVCYDPLTDQIFIVCTLCEPTTGKDEYRPKMERVCIDDKNTGMKWQQMCKVVIPIENFDEGDFQELSFNVRRIGEFVDPDGELVLKSYEKRDV